MNLRFDNPPFDSTRKPTTKQRLWGALFMAMWRLCNDNAAGSGKTWFWANVIGFIQLQDPWVMQELRRMEEEKPYP